jgi:hypothetical protein
LEQLDATVDGGEQISIPVLAGGVGWARFWCRFEGRRGAAEIVELVFRARALMWMGSQESPDVQLSAVSPQSDVGTLGTSSEALLRDQLVSLFAALIRRKESRQSAVRGGARDEVISFLRRWVDAMDRRELLHLFGWVATAVAGSPVLGSLNADEQERVAKAIASPSRVDEQVISNLDQVLAAAERNDAKLGPQAALATVLAQRELIETMIPDCPDRFRLAQVNIQAHDIDGAASIVGEAAELATMNRSPRLLKRLRDVRADLAPWQDARAVRELDTRLAGYHLT